MICNMKPCYITSRSLIITWLSDSNKTTAQILKCAISRICVYYFIVLSCCLHSYCEFEPCSWRGVLDTTLYDKVCQWLSSGWWFSPVNPVSFTNKIDRHDITEILLKTAWNTITLTQIVVIEDSFNYILFINFRFPRGEKEEVSSLWSNEKVL